MKQIERNSFVRAVALLFAFAFLCGTFAGCAGGKNPEPGTKADGPNASVAPETAIKIIQNGVAVYSLVYPANPSKSVQSAMGRFLDEIEKATGVRLSSKTDAIKRGTAYDSASCEILFGRTGYEESQSVLKTLKDDQFAIRAVGNKIVITSPKDANLDAAVSKFCDMVIKNQLYVEKSGMKTLCLEEYTSEPEETASVFAIDGVALSEFQIVYAAEPAGLSEAAFRLQGHFREKFGVSMNCNSETAATQTEHEILIGRTDRDLSKALYNETPGMLMAYRFVAKNGNLALVCGGAYSALNAVSAFSFQYNGASAAPLTEGTYLQTDLLSVQRQELTAGANLRVMTSNILADRWVGESRKTMYPVVPQRAEIYAAMLAVYQPDLIGVQESDMPWVEALPSYLNELKIGYGLDYTWIENRYEDLANLTSIIYNSTRFELLDHGTSEYGYCNHTAYKCRMLTWGVFRDQSDGKTYALMNTHFGTEGKEQSVEYEIPPAVDRIGKLTTQYENIRIFSTGDFNNHLNHSFEEYKQMTGLIDSKEAAAANGTLVKESPGIPEGIYIDHVFTNQAASSVKRYETIEVNYATTVSDHRFQYGDYTS